MSPYMQMLRPARLVAVLIALVVVLALMLLSPLKASAHVPAVTSQCGSLSVNLQNYRTSYGQEQYNSVVTTIDGTVVDNVHFGASYTQRYTLTKYQDHSYKVQVTAWDDPTGSKGWTKTYTGTIKACEQPPKTPVAGAVTFTEGTVTCVDHQVVYTNPTFVVAGNEHVVYDTTRGVHQANFGQTVTVKETGVDNPSLYTLTGQTVFPHKFANAATPPSNCVPAHHLWPTASVTANCRCHATVVLNNQASNIGYTYPVSYTHKVNGHWKHVMRNVHVRAGTMKVLHLKHLKHYSEVRVGRGGALLTSAHVPGPCMKHTPHSGR